MEYYEPKNAFNLTYSWNLLQGYTHPTDDHVVARRDLNARYVSIQNSSERPIGVAITTYYCGGPNPEILFILGPGEVKPIGINPPGAPMQFLHILDPVTGQPVGHPTAFRTDVNAFVLRDGLQNWFVHFFKYPVYRPAF